MSIRIFNTTIFLLISFFTFSQNSTVNVKPVINGYYVEKPIVVGGRNPVVYANRIVMQRLGNKVRGYYGWAAQGESEYFFEGKIVGNKINATMQSLYEYSSDSTYFNKTITILKDALTLKNDIDNPIMKLRLKQDYLNQQVDIYAKPDLQSTLIKSDYNLNNKGFVIIEIGEIALTGDQYRPRNIWYKVKNDLIEGWVLGLVSVF